MKWIGIIILSLVTCACWKPKKLPQHPEILVQKPLIKSEAFVLRYIGIIKSVQNVNIRARVDGYLQERLFKDGDILAKDQILYRIDNRPYQAALLSAKGAMDKAKANLIFQDLQLQRYTTMYAKHAVSKASLDQQSAAYLEAKGQLELAQGDYEKAKINLDFCDIRSPMQGLAGKNLVDPGNLISMVNNPNLVNIVQLDPIRVEFNPPSTDLIWFHQFQQYQPYPVRVTIPQYSKHFWQGKLDFFNNVVNESTGTILLRATLENKPLQLRPDLYVDVAVTLNPNYRFVFIPHHLVQSIQGLFQVQVVDKTMHIAIRNLRLGEIQQDYVQVVDGLEADDLIVAKPSTLAVGTQVLTKLSQS